MNERRVGARIADLAKLLGQMSELNEQLAPVLESKIEAMRRADTEGMGTCEQREARLIEQLRERDGFRKQLMDIIGTELGLPPKAGRTLNLTQLGLRVNEAERAALVAAGNRLRSEVAGVRQVERVASAVSREILYHLQWIFAAVKPHDDHGNEYSPDGALVRRGGSAMVELLG